MSDTEKVGITAGSFSRLSVYAECPFRAKLQYVTKIKENDRPPPPPGKEHANDRGSRIHDEAERYVKGETEVFVHELANFEEEIGHLKSLYATGSVLTEQLWTFDDTWTSCSPEDYESIWLRVICDGMVFLSDEDAVIIDYKTGKRVRNEVKHAQQGQLYMVAAFLKFPDLQKITVEFWYLDQDEMYQMTYTREQGMKFFKTWNNKMLTMTSDTEFEAKPSIYTCRFCPYQDGKNKWITGTGDCTKNPT